MPIAINGSGTITGISAGGLPDGVITTDDIAANAVTYAKIGTTEQGQLCKAFVNFNGTSTVAIRASYNVSSITDNGTGDYTVNFTTVMSDVNYCWAVNGHRGDGAGQNGGFSLAYATAANAYTSATVSSLRVITQGSAGSTGIDWPAVCVSIFR